MAHVNYYQTIKNASDDFATAIELLVLFILIKKYFAVWDVSGLRQRSLADSKTLNAVRSVC